VTEPLATLITALVAAAGLAVLVTLLWAATLAALWRARRQRGAAREQARYHADRAAQLVNELDSYTERTRPVAAALLGQDGPGLTLADWSAQLAEIRALPETPATWPVIPGPDGPEADR
jgi:hypothetical protein